MPTLNLGIGKTTLYVLYSFTVKYLCPPPKKRKRKGQFWTPTVTQSRWSEFLSVWYALGCDHWGKCSIYFFKNKTLGTKGSSMCFPKKAKQHETKIWIQNKLFFYSLLSITCIYIYTLQYRNNNISFCLINNKVFNADLKI